MVFQEARRAMPAGIRYRPQLPAFPRCFFLPRGRALRETYRIRSEKILQLATTPVDTQGYDSLLSLVENTASDSFDLYYGLFMYNQARAHFSLSLCSQACVFSRHVQPGDRKSVV